ncbi:MAG: SPOR domain-containing protein [Zoogloea sp.]|nr:SPOR domain-containing protein [Zoogloea sp.]
MALVLPEDVALVQPARPIPPVRKARSQPAVAVARQAPAPVAAQAAAAVEAPRTVQPELPASVQPAAAPAVVASAATVSGKVPERGASQVFLQLGSFPSLPNAESFKVFVESELKWLRESVLVLSSEGKYRLHIGPFASAVEARSMAERIAGTLKLKPFVVQR